MNRRVRWDYQTGKAILKTSSGHVPGAGNDRYIVITH